MTGNTREIGRIEQDFIIPSKILGDEARLFEAHVQLARNGHASEFPVAVKALLSAPMIPADGGQAKVVKMEIDTVGMLLVHGQEELVRTVAVRDGSDDEESANHFFYEYRNPEKFGHPGPVSAGPDHHRAFGHHPDYIRHLVIEYAQRAFTAGVSDLSRRGFSDRDFAALGKRIRTDVDAAFDNIFYVANHSGSFVGRTNQPRLVLVPSKWDDEIHLALRRGSFDPMSHWISGLLSFPAELPRSALCIREAVYTAESGKNWMNMGFSSCDDQVIGSDGMFVRRDIADLDRHRDAEFAIYANAVCEMARAVMDHRGEKTFSAETLVTCSWFADIEPLESDYRMDMVAEAWDDHLGDLCVMLRQDGAAFAEFLSSAGWPLKASPLTVMGAKLNRLLDREMLHGLVAVAPKHYEKAPGV
ncbi:hypothetical protein HFO56_01420 [Rhizobium laguerreae]|uniref:hypothetical protein n=1 Tax=Rhizobium laguerreae TaxID=1076926 RepID=UPI001C926FAF|nr:hypothetical protein [Rhizobium laguerreae]MBY3151069.1 hypothetical protein [Rhizobium laguerreae]